MEITSTQTVHGGDISGDTKGDIVAVENAELGGGEKGDYDYMDAQRGAAFEQSLTYWQAVKVYRKAIFWAFIASLSIIMEGYDSSVTGNFGSMLVWRKTFGRYYPKINDWQVPAQWNMALSYTGTLGNIIGISSGGWLIERSGYRKALMFFYAAFMPMVAITAFAHNVGTLLAGGFLQGIPFGIFSTLAIGYASEVCPVRLRPFLTGWANICWVLGIFLGTGIATAIQGVTSEWGFRAGYMTQWIWPIPLFIAMYLGPESPWWLIRKGRISEAQASMERLLTRSHHEHAPQIVAQMIRTHEFELQTLEKSRWRDCFQPIHRRRTEIACVAFAAQTLCGDPFAGGPIYFFEQAGMTQKQAFQFGLANPAVLLVSNFISYGFMTRCGRRTLYIWGLFLLGGLLLFIGGLQILADKGRHDALWGIAAIIYLWNAVRSVTLGPTCYSIVAEASSVRLRNKTIALARITYILTGVVVGAFEPYMINPSALNWKGKTAFFWAPISVLTGIWAFFRLPEFKDRSFYEIDVLFERKVSARKFRSTVVEENTGEEAGIARMQLAEAAVPGTVAPVQMIATAGLDSHQGMPSQI